MSSPTLTDRPASKGMRTTFAIFSGIERVGNKLPHPFWLFWILAAVVAVLSAILAGLDVSVISPADNKPVVIKSLLSAEGLQTMIGDIVDNYASFPPLATILTTMLGIVIAERSGLFDTALRLTITRMPARFVTFGLSFAAMISHVAGDAAYVTLIPLGAIIFRAVGKSPVLGAIVAFVSISAGYDASPSLTTTDVLLSSITTAAAHTIDESITVTPVANYFFGLASSLLIAVTITVVVETVLAKRPDLHVDEDYVADEEGDAKQLEISAKQRAALRWSLIFGLVYIAAVVAVLIPHGSPFRGEEASILESPIFSGMAGVIGLLFAGMGAIYGAVSGSYAGPKDLIAAMIQGFKNMAPILVLFFAISQFLAYFKWTGIGEVMAIKGAELLKGASAPGWLILLGMAVIISIMNFVITSGSAMWSLAAPIFVPMLLLLGIEPATTQAAYRVADSVTNCVTPMSPYFVMALGFIQQYRKSAGIGTLASFTMPLAAVVWVVWMAFFLAWYVIGIPFGPAG
ncbi:AbgT family transporter [Microlunatus soli]|uniref:AbgT family transporter n=1 Tax=Microlunatus soli TaxID=630515 RepID=UPI001E65D42E|nr:AbgT family transporter [Microlunatus soli]